MDVLVDLFQNYPWFGNLVIFMGMARMICKPLFTLIDAVIVATPSKHDDQIWSDVKGSKAMSMFLWLIDYLASVKIRKS